MKKETVEFSKEFRASPVPIRLNCRFTNGINLSYHVRAVSCTDRVLRVVSVNPFERGIQLTVMAPFLSGLSRCSVVGVTRSKRLASYFDVELRFVEPPALLSPDDANSAPHLQETLLFSEDIAAAASSLGAALESTIGIPFTRAFAKARPQNRHPGLLSAIAATLLLLQDKGFADSGLVVKSMQRASGNESQNFPPAAVADSENYRTAT